MPSPTMRLIPPYLPSLFPMTDNETLTFAISQDLYLRRMPSQQQKTGGVRERRREIRERSVLGSLNAPPKCSLETGRYRALLEVALRAPTLDRLCSFSQPLLIVFTSLLFTPHLL